jgi:hypothetical protein
MGRDSESLQLELRTNLAKKLLVDRQRKVWKKLDICADDRLHNSLDYVSGEGPIHTIKKHGVILLLGFRGFVKLGVPENNSPWSFVARIRGEEVSATKFNGF